MSMELIKKLREMTGAGMMDVKKALDEANGDEAKAKELLRKRGQDKALKKGDREAKEGVLGVYVHSNGKVGAMVKLFCETDFVARNEEFRELAKDIAMHITASNPLYIKPEEVTEELVAKEREIWAEQMKDEKKPEDILAKILEGKEKKFREENALLTQPFIKDTSMTVGQVIAEKIGKIGENIQVGEFSRLEL